MTEKAKATEPKVEPKPAIGDNTQLVIPLFISEINLILRSLSKLTIEEAGPMYEHLQLRARAAIANMPIAEGPVPLSENIKDSEPTEDSKPNGKADATDQANA